LVTPGFQGRPRREAANLPPGQQVVDDFPILTAGPTIYLEPEEWELTVRDGAVSKRYTWESIHQLSQTNVTVDIHCVTHWSKLGTNWSGVAVGDLLDDAGVSGGEYASISSYGDYSTNMPVEDLVNHDAIVATSYENGPIEAEHGGPVRLLVPHLYLWKSAKWVREIRLTAEDEPGFWERLGYHIYGDPWQEQRYFGD
jgi:DMSO/TMAO reductase YedYZ molybdopterin-dependent catalytic subunit